MARPRGDGPVAITAHSYETLALNTTLAYPAPYSSREGDHFDYWWHLIQYAFDLPDPSTFPELPISAEDLPLVKRYCSAADDLAGSQFLAHPTQLSISFNENSHELVTKVYPPTENVRGFSVLLRQFHSNKETACFHKVQGALRRACTLLPTATESQLASRHLGLWARAAGQARGTLIKVLVGRRLIERGLMGPGPVPAEDESPERLISLFNYGEDIHWGKRRDDLSALGVDDFTQAWARMNFFEAASGLAHLYMGFAVLARSALGSTFPD